MSVGLWIAAGATVAAIVSAVAAVWSEVAARRALRASVAPVIVFAREEEGRPWTIRNDGNGPAINIRVQGRDDRGNLSLCLLYHPIPPGGFRDNRTSVAGELIAVYRDLNGNRYVSKCKQDDNSYYLITVFGLLRGRSFGRLTKGWSLECYVPAIACRSTPPPA